MKKIIQETKDKFIKNKIYLVILIIFWIFAIIINDPFSEENNICTIVDSTEVTKISDKITKEVELSQKFVAEKNNLRQIGIMASTDNKIIDTNIHITVTDISNNKIIFDNECSTKELKNNSYFEIFLENQENSKGKEYEIIIHGNNGTSENAIVFWEALDIENSKNYTVNGIPSENKLMYKTTYMDSNIGTVNISLWGIIFIVSFIFVLNIGEKLDEKQFLKFSIVLGICMLVITPFCHSLDEGTHFFRSYMISQGDFYDEKDDNGNIGGYVSKNFPKYMLGNNISFKNFFSNTSSIDETFDNEKVFYKLPYLSSTLPINHTVSSIGIFIGRILNLNVISIVVLARAMNLIFYIICSYFAIKNLKYYKSVMFVIATIPMGLWLSATVSIDPILNGACFLFVSICLKYYFDQTSNENISIIDMILLIITECFIVSVKYLVYSPLLLLFFIIPKKKFKNKKHYVILIFIAVLIGILIVAWQMYLLSIFQYTEDRNGNVDIAKQLEFIYNNKLFAIKTFFKTFCSLILFSIQDFGYCSAIYHINFIIGTIILLSAILEKNKFIIDKKINIFFTLLFLFIFTLGLLAEYLAFTPIGNNIILGYQIRYFIPIIILILLPISQFFDITNNMKNYEKNITFCMTIVNMNLILGLLLLNFSNSQP